MSLLNAIISILCLVGLALAIMHRRRPSAGKRKEITTLERVKRRRRLTKRLNRIVGDEFEAMQLLREEARDLHLPASNLETLEAAIKRARLERKPSAPLLEKSAVRASISRQTKTTIPHRKAEKIRSTADSG